MTKVKNNLSSSQFALFISVGVLFVLVALFQWTSHSNRGDILNSAESSPLAINNTNFEKQKGAHVFGIGQETDFSFLHNYNLEWITLVSWGFQDDYDSPKVSHHNGDMEMYRKSDSAWVERIKLVKENGFKVFLKPHLWINNASDGKWRSDVYPTSDENWELWKESYSDFIVRYAKVAEEGNADMFCIGIEFTKLAKKKPLYWKKLIQEVRAIYSGKITYAANWYREFEHVEFWEDLDFIGIQAYFPLTKKETPNVPQLTKGWNKYLSDIQSISKKYNRKVVFTEMGYKSTADSAIRPWEWIEDPKRKQSPLSIETQANCYKAFFENVWDQEWFAGVHIWQLRGDYGPDRLMNPSDFSPQGKLAENVISQGFE